MLIYQSSEDDEWSDEAPNLIEKEYYEELSTLKYYGKYGIVKDSRQNDLDRARDKAETEIKNRLRLLDGSSKTLLLDRCLRDAKKIKAKQLALFSADVKDEADYNRYRASEEYKKDLETVHNAGLDIPRPKNIFDELKKSALAIYQETKNYKYHSKVAAKAYRYKWLHEQNISSIDTFIINLENKRDHLPDTDIAILKLPIASSKIVNLIGVSRFPVMEKSLLDRGYIDSSGQWQKTANELAAFIWVLKDEKYLKDRSNKINRAEKEFFQSRYNTKSKFDLGRKTMASNKTKIKTHIASFMGLIKVEE